MKLTPQQANCLHRLFAACENAKNFTESLKRQERLDSYMVNLMDKGVDSKEITDLLY